ncbi:diacylglycerol/lipid kinase family protein [Actinoallomurus rhizosphaericola]|uniref:diacylglycerol/lipid kinase family protein n=1 Tax=Actinoallomurus rhizosphaericola TaxID=2952536 RepID=UPI002090E10F|nr:YegS/Rv2252/BmrU family lipid kinase [Actinoallomurus rhizosphaericola]MCO5993426.1 diacylglycerol kinase family lipid kinase [Actinoallomurus rhizosphaericola]
MRSFTAVVNPAAGGDAAARLIPLARLLREAGAEMTVEYSRSLEHAAELARTAADKGHTVVAAGGDGMVGGLAGALAGTDGVLGILPAGRGNDFARQLGLPEEPDRLAALLLEAEPRRIDAIEVTTPDGGARVVAGSVYAGVDSVANVHINRLTRLPGSLAYYLGPLRAIATWRPVSYRVTVDGELHEERGYTVVVANSGFYGYGLHIAPDAAVDDGLLDVVIIRHAPKRLFFAVMRELPKGTHVHRPVVEVLRGREVRVEADRDIPYGADGELLGDLPATARVLPGALNVIADPA